MVVLLEKAEPDTIPEEGHFGKKETDCSLFVVRTVPDDCAVFELEKWLFHQVLSVSAGSAWQDMANPSSGRVAEQLDGGKMVEEQVGVSRSSPGVEDGT